MSQSDEKMTGATAAPAEVGAAAEVQSK